MTTILIIDDDENFRSLLADWLIFEGFQSIVAADGFHGIQLAKKHQPDLILCDLNMPVLDGFEVLKQLQNDIRTAPIHFFFLTSDPSLNSAIAQSRQRSTV